MIHAEASQCSDSWLIGLEHDLVWPHGVEAHPDDTLLDRDHSILIDTWQRCSASSWKSRIRRASHRHLFQESMMLEAQLWHQKIFAMLREYSFTFHPDPLCFHMQDGHFPCPDCHRVFQTPQGVHLHRRKVHGNFAPEHHLLDSATCPACMKFLWSTQRLQQHLSHQPNPCLPTSRGLATR